MDGIVIEKMKDEENIKIVNNEIDINENDNQEQEKETKEENNNDNSYDE